MCMSSRAWEFILVAPTHFHQFIYVSGHNLSRNILRSSGAIHQGHAPQPASLSSQQIGQSIRLWCSSAYLPGPSGHASQPATLPPKMRNTAYNIQDSKAYLPGPSGGPKLLRRPPPELAGEASGDRPCSTRGDAMGSSPRTRLAVFVRLAFLIAFLLFFAWFTGMSPALQLATRSFHKSSRQRRRPDHE